VSNRLIRLAIATLVAAAACTGESEAGSDRLAIVDETGNVAIITDNVTTPLSDLPPNAVAFQPVWSPDGEHLAYVEQSAVTGALVITRPGPDDTPARIEENTGFFYYAWDPKSGQLATLRNAPSGSLVLELADIDGGLAELDSGAPLYFSWEPTGERLAAHIGVDRLDIVEDSVGPVPIIDDPGSFQSPWWTNEGIVFLQRGVANQRLVVVDGAKERVVADVIGTAQFTVGDSLIAVQSFSSGEDAVAAYLQSTPLLPAGRLVVVDLETSDVTAVSDANVTAFFWDPAGQQLLFLEIVDSETGRFRWQVWSATETRSFAEFVVEPTWLRDFLPFFDQYAQSVRLWSPDGSAFAFPGSIDGEVGIWIQRLDEDAPEKIGGGSWVAWSP
jgi:TolB protein